MGQQLGLLSLWTRIAIYAAVWFLVFLPGRSTIAVVSGAVISYSAAALGRRGGASNDPALNHALRADRQENIWRDQQPQEPFATGYDLYSPSENRWIVGGSNCNYPTGDALFDYLHFSLSNARSQQESLGEKVPMPAARREMDCEQGKSRAARVGRSRLE